MVHGLLELDYLNVDFFIMLKIKPIIVFLSWYHPCNSFYCKVFHLKVDYKNDIDLAVWVIVR